MAPDSSGAYSIDIINSYLYVGGIITNSQKTRNFLLKCDLNGNDGKEGFGNGGTDIGINILLWLGIFIAIIAVVIILIVIKYRKKR